MRTDKQKNKPQQRVERRLKISYRNMHLGGPYLDLRTQRVPQLRLQGKWLQQLGFHPSAHVHVTATEGLLIISNIV